MQDSHLKVDAKLLYRFLTLCEGNWHACVYVDCQSCTYEHPCTVTDFLFLPDAEGKPCLFPMSDARVLFARVPEAEECLLRITLRDFLMMYKKLLESLNGDKSSCPIKQLLKLEVDACYEW